jgi:hypothetical protein
MKAFRIAAATLALGTSIAVAPGLASANKKHPRHNNGAAPASNNPHMTKYIFRGLVVSTPTAGSNALSVDVRSGNKAGITLMGTNPTLQVFHLAPTTQLFSWNAAGTTATPMAPANLYAGDPVAITVWGPSKTTLVQLMGSATVNRVDDVLNSSKPAGRMFIFVAKVISQDTAASTVTVDLIGGNWRAQHAFTGQGAVQTFHYSSSTVFLNFNGKGKARLQTTPTLVNGSTITIRVFSANYSSDPLTLLNSGAWRINSHEPARLVNQDIKAHNDHKM